MITLEKEADKVVLTIYGYVGGWAFDAENMATILGEISASGFKNVDLHIHTIGGDVIEGNLIFNFIRSFKGNLEIYIDGLAASMGAMIAMAASKIHIAENGFVMIHEPRGGGEGTAKEFEMRAKVLRSMGKNFRNILIKRTGNEVEVDKWLSGGDHWFDADEAIAAGLVDDKFSAEGILIDEQPLEKSDAVSLGATAVFQRFTASLDDKNKYKNQSNQQSTKKEEMDKKVLIARYNLSLTETNSEEEILTAIDTKLAESISAVAAMKRTSIIAAVEAAIAAKKITAEAKESYIAKGEKLGLDDLNAIFKDMQVYQPLTSQINSGNQAASIVGRENWNWDQYQKEDSKALEAMAKTDYAKFSALYKSKFGVEAPK